MAETIMIIAMIALGIMLIATMLQGFRPRTDDERILDARRLDERERERRKDENTFLNVVPGVEKAEEDEKKKAIGIEEVLHTTNGLLNSEKNAELNSARLLREEKHDGDTVVGKGFPEGQNILRICGEQDAQMKIIWDALIAEDKTAERVEQFMKRSEKTLRWDTHKFDEALWRAEADKATGKGEDNRDKKEDNEEKTQYLDESAVVNEQREILNLVHDIRKASNTFSSLNEKIEKLMGTRKDKLEDDLHILRAICEKTNTKIKICQKMDEASRRIVKLSEESRRRTNEAAEEALAIARGY